MNTSTSLTTPLHGHTVTAGSVLTLDTPADVQPTISAFTRRPRKLTVEETVRVMKNGQMHHVTVESVHFGWVVTSDWNSWWTRYPDRDWGDARSQVNGYLIG